MAIVKLEIPRGLRAKMRADGLSIVDNPNTYYYRVKKKNQPKIVENNIQFGIKSSMISMEYKALSEREKELLKTRMEKESELKNPWVFFVKMKHAEMKDK